MEEDLRTKQKGQILAVKDLPRVTGVMWLRFTLAPLPAGGRSQAILLDMGSDIPAAPVLYQPVDNPATGGTEWREITPSHRNVLLLPEPGAEPEPEAEAAEEAKAK